MDTTDPGITFDAAGECNHCRTFTDVTSKGWFPNEEGGKRLAEMLDKVREEGKGREYDCILGLSGGVDSSYLALKMKDWGLRPLVVHVDAGWNSELAVWNIEKLVRHCGYDLHTHVVDWGEIRDLHLAYLASGIPNQDVPQDHVFFASLYQFATKNGIRYIMSGGNLATEGIFPDAWHGSAMDSINLKAIHRKHGRMRLETFTTIGFFQYYVWFPLAKRMQTLRPLNYMPYVKADAVEELVRVVGYKPYQRKHGESLFTKVFQNYYLPVRFNYDKRRPHLSSLIVSGQLTRSEALQRLEEPLYEAEELERDLDYFCKKLSISRAEFDAFVRAPLKHHTDFKTWDSYYRALKGIQRFVERVSGKRVRVYS